LHKKNKYDNIILRFSFLFKKKVMAITKSAKKALRQSLKRRARNRRQKEKIKSLIKQVKGLVYQKKAGESKKFLPQIYKLLDKAAKTGLIKKNTATRKKARITKLINKNI
jgi:small subunit ribosomal protein S20